MSRNRWFMCGLSLLTVAIALLGADVNVRAADKKSNIVVIMGDDIGWFNIGAYHQGMMAGRNTSVGSSMSSGGSSSSSSRLPSWP